MTDTPVPASGTPDDRVDEVPAFDATSTMAIRTGAEINEPVDNDAPELVAIEGLAPGTALLVVRRGPNAGSRFLLDAEATTTGRAPDSDIFLDDITVSRRHAEFRRVEGGFQVVDVGSLNGTYLNRSRVDDASLTSGDEVQIGKYRLVFHQTAPTGSTS